MTKHEAVVHTAIRFALAVRPAQQMLALYELRKLIVEEPLETVLSIDAKLVVLEAQVAEEEKDPLRALGYQFPEDFDTPTEFLCGG